MPDETERTIHLEDFESLEKKVNELQETLRMDDVGIRMSCIDFALRAAVPASHPAEDIVKGARIFYEFITKK